MEIDPAILNVNNQGESGDETESCLTAKRYEALASSFTVPASGSSTTLTVCDSSQYGVGLWVWVYGAGWFEVIGIPSSTTIAVKNNGTSGNATAGTVIATGNPFICCDKPSGMSGSSSGFDIHDTLSATFTIPGSGADTDLYVTNGGWFQLSSWLFIMGAGWFQITTLDASDSTHCRVTNVADYADINKSAGSLSAGTEIFCDFPAPYLPDGTTLELHTTGSPDVGEAQIRATSIIPRTPDLGWAQIQCDQETGITMTSATDDEALTSVVFVTPFKVATEPVIVLSIDKDDDMGELFSLYVRNVTNAGFDIYGSNNFAGNEDVNINWIAIGAFQ